MWLNNNPFYILNAQMNDSVPELINREKMRRGTNEKCAEALAVLRNPRRRIAAELRWPWEGADINRQALCNLIDNGRKILPSRQYSSLSNINILIHDLELYRKEDVMIVVHAVEKLDELFSKVNMEEITADINQRRGDNFPKAKVSHVEQEMENLIEEIKKSVTSVLQEFCAGDYHRGIKEIAKSLENTESLTLFRNDAILRYELYFRSEMDELHSKIRERLEAMKVLPHFKMALLEYDIQRDMCAFGELAYPMIAKAAAEGRSYDYAIELFREFRNTYVGIYNERDFYYEAQQMAEILMGVMKINCSLREKVCEDLKQML